MAKASYRLRTLQLRNLNSLPLVALDILKEAAAVYIMEAYRHVHVDTGMSRASLVPLARVVGVDVPISPKRSTAKKNIGKGLSQSYYRLSTTRTQATLEWSTSVFQYFLNEQYPIRSNKGSPWYSLVQGTIKAKSYLLRSYPQMARAVKQSWSYKTIGA